MPDYLRGVIPMKIGELAGATGLTAKTIRFYEGAGLLPPPARTASGYRAYGSADLERVDFIRKAKQMGLSLDEIKEILGVHHRNEPTCEHVRSLLDAKLLQVDNILKNLQGFRRELAGLRERVEAIADCRPSGGRICGIIEDSSFGSSGEALTRIRSSVRVGK